MSAAGKNLAVIDRAIKQHAANCERPLVAIEMCHFEVERLGWDAYQGIPIVDVGDALPSGRFRLVCEGDLPVADEQRTEAVA